MYLKKVEIHRYRNYNKTELSFQEGINIIIGPNNAGKSNLLKVINFLDNTDSTASVHDFNKNDIIENLAKYQNEAPRIEIIYHIEHAMNLSSFDDGILRFKNFIIYNTEGKVLSDNDGNYIILAAIKLNFELDEDYINEYKSLMENKTTYSEFITAFEKIISHYSWNYYNTTSNTPVKKSEVKAIFNIDFVEADRQTEKTLPRTKSFVEDKLKEFNGKIDLRNEIDTTINDNLSFIKDEIKLIFENDEDAIGIKNSNNQIIPRFRYDSPFHIYFEFGLQDVDLEYEIPMDSNGLGYNNLIQIYGIIKLKIDNDYNLLLIEEPEAHLHPAMQYKLFKYLNDLKEKNDVQDESTTQDDNEIKENTNGRIIKNQIFITTHSPNITASADIDDMISLFYYRNIKDKEFEVNSINLKEQFICIEDEKINTQLQIAKNHLAKFLDVTRSDLLFTQKTILVEGLAEKLLMPSFAKKCGLEYELEHNHISIVEVGGITFNNFTPLFYNTQNKLLCFRDCDYDYYEKDEKNNKVIFKGLDSYLSNLNDIKLDEPYNSSINIELFTQRDYGSTFENELFINNYSNADVTKKIFKLVVPGKLSIFLDNNDFSLIQWYDKIDDIGNKKIQDKVIKFLELYKSNYDNAEGETKSLIEKVFFANLFLEYASNSKGNLAITLLTSGLIDEIEVPTYIKEGLEWIKN